MKSFLFLLTICLGALAIAPARAEIDFDKQVKPIFADNCYKCHGEENQKGKLRLDSPAMIRKGGDSGEPVFLVGKSAESHVIKLVSRLNSDDAMPPDGKGDPLSEAQVDTLRRWIDEGGDMPAASISCSTGCRRARPR